jgi:hypothetical protein
MNTPVRTLVRNAIVTAISDAIAAVPSLGGRVKAQRYHSISVDELAGGPVAFVQAGDEEMSSALEWPRPRSQEIRYAIDVVVVAQNAGDVDAAVDVAIAECARPSRATPPRAATPRTSSTRACTTTRPTRRTWT